MRSYIVFVLVLALIIAAGHCYGNDYVISIDPSAHQKYGLYYPGTYRFSIPPGSSGLVVQYRYSPDSNWNALREKSGSDTFNGIETVRFDYAGGWAYISIGFNRSSDQVYLRIVDRAGNPINFTFDSVPKYYDGRNAAVAVTLDDWTASTANNFAVASAYLASYGLPFTAAIISGRADWSLIQRTIDSYPDNIEIASHSANHPCDATAYVAAGYDAEVAGSKDAITRNLTFKANPYVPVYVEPCGYSDTTLVSSITNAGYLVTRKAGTFGGSSFVAWDAVQQRYGRSAIVLDDSVQPWDSSQLSQANALFNTAISGGGIYLLLNHPEKGFWFDNSYLLQHLQYIKGRNDIWYAGLGQLYLYHFLQEGRGNLTFQSIPTNAPTANFTATPLTGTAPLSVTFTDTSTGSITGRLWDFGDSATSTEQNPVHVYGGAGSYTVKLTVTGPDGSDQKTMSGFIVVNEPAPIAGFTATPRSGTRPLTVTFTDTSTGSITSRIWDFGDSTTSTEQNPVHVYSSTGSYTVKLTVAGPGGSNARVEQGYIAVNYGAGTFTATPSTGTAPLSVSFNEAFNTLVTSRLWDFGDSTTSSAKNPVHVYSKPGSYTVTLTVTGPGGSSEIIQPDLVVLKESAPAANFTAKPVRGTPYTISFLDASTGSITSRQWDFGDSTTSTEMNPVHAYGGPGTYTVKLTVTGPGGSSDLALPIKVGGKRDILLPILLPLLK